MFAMKNLVIILFVICSSQYSHGAIEVVEKSQIFDDGIFFNNEKSFNNGILVYAICDSDTENTTNCKVVQERYPYDEAADSCQVTIENIHLNGDGSLSLTVIALGEDKAILYWWYRKLEDHSLIMKIGTVDLKTCQMNSVTVPDANGLVMMDLIYRNNLVSYSDDSFDVFYSDPYHVPEEGELYEIQIDGDGKMISEAKSANVERGVYSDVFTVANRSPAKGFVFVKRNQYKSRKEFSRIPVFHVLLVKPDGTSKHLGEYKRDNLGSVAAGNNFISMCHKSEDKGHIMCTQYDEYGNVLFTTTLATKNFDIDIIKSYNLPNGGMLVMYGATKHNLKESIHKKTGYEVVWIDSKGKVKGRIYGKKSEVPKGMFGVPYIYAKGDKEYCATVVINNEYTEEIAAAEVPVNLKIVANCFTENDLLA